MMLIGERTPGFAPAPARLVARTRAMAVRSLVARTVRERLSRRQHAEQARRAAAAQMRWITAARELDVPSRRVADRGLELLAGSERFVVGPTRWSLEQSEALEATRDRAATLGMLEANGLPVVPHVRCTIASLDTAFAFIAAARRPCTLRPALTPGTGTGTATGTGATSGITGERALIRAAADAAAACASVGSTGPLAVLPAAARGLDRVPLMVEEDVPGERFRVLVVDGVAVDAVRIHPRTGPVRAGLNAQTLTECVRAVEHVGARMAGVELVVSDPTVALSRGGGCIRTVAVTTDLTAHQPESGFDPARVVLERLSVPSPA
ncbi:hypothetical protein [Pseudonocardia sp. TRM90224]|uniref:hypothetical protein n=1 Tax=Pseudonocardia sp. TRM90224 TaxID=2812678 RepID=UPI001E5A3F62|nr:hypothetical protein [Pseudonocardia sp. TRM90224]